MACVTACPSGVQYDRLIEQTRVEVEAAPAPRRSPSGCCARRCSPCSRTAGACARRSRCGRLPAPGPLGGAEGGSRRRGPRRRGRRSTRPGDGPRASRCSPAACRASSSATSTPPPRACSPPRASTCPCRARRAAAARCTPTPAASTDGVARARELERALARLRPHRHQRRRLRLAPQGPRRRRAPSTSPSCSRAPRGATRHPLAITVAFQDSCHLRHAQGIVGRAARDARRDPRPAAARARRSGHLLRQRRHLQPRAARGRRRARRAQGAGRARDRRAGLREREPRLPGPGQRGAAPRRAGRCPPFTRSSCSTPRSAASSPTDCSKEARR